MAHFKAPAPSSSARRSTARRRESSRSTSCASPTGRGGTARWTSRRTPRALLEYQPAPPPERGRHFAADEPAQGIAHDGAPPSLVEPAVLAAEQLGDVGPGGQQGLVEIEIVGDLAHHPRTHGHGGRRRRRVAPLRRHADLLGCHLLPPAMASRISRARPCADADRRPRACAAARRRCGAAAARSPGAPDPRAPCAAGGC